MHWACTKSRWNYTSQVKEKQSWARWQRKTYWGYGRQTAKLLRNCGKVKCWKLRRNEEGYPCQLISLCIKGRTPASWSVPHRGDSWCRYQQNKANKTNLYKHGPGLPLTIIAQIKPEYQRLNDDSLLQKCLHGKKQSQNEALNGMVWQRVPEEVYVGLEILELGLYDAVAHFNNGLAAVIKLFNALGITPGK